MDVFEISCGAHDPATGLYTCTHHVVEYPYLHVAAVGDHYCCAMWNDQTADYWECRDGDVSVLAAVVEWDRQHAVAQTLVWELI